MLSFEQEIKNFFSTKNIKFQDHSSSFKLMDFTFQTNNSKTYHIDAKEKRQKINLKNWNAISAVDEPYSFIIDDLAARKTLAYAPRSGLIVRDSLTNKYYWFSVLDLFLMPKKRVNRRIEKKILTLKGKWIIDFRNASMAHSMKELFELIIEEEAQILKNYTETIECYGNYYGEEKMIQGEIRRLNHWDVDVNETR